MKKKWIRYSLISLGTLLLLIVLANLGLNYWLQNNLPKYIKKNTDYAVTYDKLKVELATGNITGTGLIIKTKQPESTEILGLEGTIDTLKISRLGIYDAIFNKKIYTSDLLLVNPVLNITLAKAKTAKQERKKSSVLASNISVKNGNIKIYKHTKAKYFAVENFNARIEGIELVDNSEKKLLPVEFKKQNISGTNFFLQPDDSKVIKAGKIETQNDVTRVDGLQIIPILSYAEFGAKYPEKNSYFSGEVARIELNDFVLKEGDMRLSSIAINQPDIKLYTYPNRNKQEKKPFQYDVKVGDLKINKGQFEMYKGEERQFSGKNLQVAVSKLELNDETVKGKIPFKYDQLSLKGNNVEAVSNNQKVVVAALALDPKNIQLNNIYFKPQGLGGRETVIDGTVKSVQVQAEDWKFNKEELKLELSNFTVEQPDLKIYTKESGSKKSKKPFNLDVSLEDFKIKNGKIQVFKGNADRIFAGSNLQFAISKLAVNKETVKNKIPVKYSQFKFSGNNVENISDHQKIYIQAMAVNPKEMQLDNVTLKTIRNFANKTAMNGSVKNIRIKTKEWGFKNNKLKLDVEKVLVNGLNGDLHLGKNKTKKKADYSGIQFPLLVRNISLKNSNLKLHPGGEPLEFKNLSADLLNLEMNTNTVKNKTPFKLGSYQISATDFKYKPGQYYNARIGSLNINDKEIKLSNLVLKPTVTRAQFVKAIPVEKDLYDLKIGNLTAKGKWDFLSNQMSVYVNNVNISNMDALIFRSKIPADDVTVKPLYSSMLSNLKFPLFVEDLNITESRLIYEEDTKKSDGPGELIFGKFNLNAKNINSGKFAGKPTNIPIVINTMMMDTTPLTVNWEFDTARSDDHFTITGHTGDMPAPSLNLFTEPYLKVRATGEISRLAFAFNGNKETLGGTFKMLHKNLKVQMLKKDGDKNVVLSAVANLFVKNDSGPNPPAILIENVKRDNTKSFFNFLWRGIEAGLKKTLVGLGSSATKIETTEEFPDDLKEIEALEKIEEEYKNGTRKKGIFKKIFKKKIKAKK